MSSHIASTPRSTAHALARLLGQHYGDRTVYLSSNSDQALFEAARAMGLISSEGQLTTEGYSYWQRHQRV